MKADNQQKVLQALDQTGLIAILRGIESSSICEVVDTSKDAGVQLVEVTLDTPDALASIGRLARQFGDHLLIGAGTVLDRESAEAAIAEGAQFVLAPTLSSKVIASCQKNDVLPIPGVFTPGEVHQAQRAGADIVKVFPAGILGTASIRNIRRLFPDLKILAVGGVDLENAAAFIHAGAAGLGIGSKLAAPDMRAPENRPLLKARAAEYLSVIRSAR